MAVGAEDHQILCGDCRELIPTLGKFQQVIADPPFNINQKYVGYSDNLRQDVFDKFTEEWIDVCWQACDGTMALHGPDNLAEAYLAISRRMNMRRIAWVNWHFRFGQCSRRNWINSRCHLIIFSKHKAHTWNPESVLVESDRVKYGDKRVAETERGGMRLPGTIWGVPSDGPYWGRVQGTNAERRGKHPNQLPEVYIARAIKAYTNPGDRLLDPFCGSGTTVAVAKALGRNCITIDVSQPTVESAMERLKRGAIRV